MLFEHKRQFRDLVAHKLFSPPSLYLIHITLLATTTVVVVIIIINPYIIWSL